MGGSQGGATPIFQIIHFDTFGGNAFEMGTGVGVGVKKTDVAATAALFLWAAPRGELCPSFKIYTLILFGGMYLKWELGWGSL